MSKLFNTDNNGYLYDTGTNKVLLCNKEEFFILECLLNEENGLERILQNLEFFELKEIIKAMSNIIHAIKHENILQVKNPNSFDSKGHFELFNQMVNTNLRQITLELTERCNLRCNYCYYNQSYSQTRNHGYVDMTMEVAKLAIDYVKKHGSVNMTDTVGITFYGGEPLLMYDLLKYCVMYAQQTITNKLLTFSMTTNLTLMTRDIAKYIASIKNFSVVCSIDGPKNIHDYNRKTIDGKGSFSKAIQGLKYLVEEMGKNAKDRISLSIVYSPPFSSFKLDSIMDFFSNLGWLPQELTKNVTYPKVNDMEYDKLYNLEKITTFENQSDAFLFSWSQKKILSKIINNEDLQILTKKSIDDIFLRIHKREIFNKTNNRFPFNGCCIPASRKIYINAKGEFLLCERIEGSLTFGDVYSGIDFKKLKLLFIDEYTSSSIKNCSKCWALRLCTICYSTCYSDNGFDIKKKNINCSITRNYIHNNLSLYHKCLELNPKKLTYLNDIVVV